jgi:zinc transport system permease protein
VLIAFFALFYRKIVAFAFDRDFARVIGLPVRFINYAMTVLIAVGIVLTIRLVGLMLLMSMFSLPQMIAEIYCHRFKSMMFASIGISLVCSTTGLLLTTVIDVPCSAIIVLIMVGTYLFARLGKVVSQRLTMQ